VKVRRADTAATFATVASRAAASSPGCPTLIGAIRGFIDAYNDRCQPFA